MNEKMVVFSEEKSLLEQKLNTQRKMQKEEQIFFQKTNAEQEKLNAILNEKVVSLENKLKNCEEKHF